MLTYAELLALAAPRIPALPYVTSSHGDFALSPDPGARVIAYFPDEVSPEEVEDFHGRLYHRWGGGCEGVETLRVRDYPATAVSPAWRLRHLRQERVRDTA